MKKVTVYTHDWSDELFPKVIKEEHDIGMEVYGYEYFDKYSDAKDALIHEVQREHLDHWRLVIKEIKLTKKKEV